jgi:hypothetical protein
LGNLPKAKDTMTEIKEDCDWYLIFLAGKMYEIEKKHKSSTGSNIPYLDNEEQQKLSRQNT